MLCIHKLSSGVYRMKRGLKEDIQGARGYSGGSGFYTFQKIQGLFIYKGGRGRYSGAPQSHRDGLLKKLFHSAHF